MQDTRTNSGLRYDRAIRACIAILVLALLAAFLLLSSGQSPFQASDPASEHTPYAPPERPRSAGAGDEHPPYSHLATSNFVRGLNNEMPWTAEIRASILVDSATSLCDAMREGATRSDLLVLSEEMGFEGPDASTFVEITELWICRVADDS